jgi:8-oxo-dGTP pyrophosphatase MutT (NUDIX family)
MKIAGYQGDLWITPGGRIRPGEEPMAALVRELQEETGRVGLQPGAEIWVRHATFLSKRQPLEEEERFFLVPSEQFEPTTARMEPAELEVFREFRWWSVEGIVGSGERFAPQRLGELLLALRRDGVPASPVETGA